MPIDNRAQLIEKSMPLIEKIRDCVGGQEVIKSPHNLEKYLPMIKGQTDAHYEVYTRTPIFIESTSRTADALSAIINRKDPIITATKSLDKTLETITFNGENFKDYCEQTVYELLVTNLQVSLVDREENGKIFVTQYRVEDLYHYEYYNNNGVQELKEIVLQEEYSEKDKDDPFTLIIKKQYRQYELVKDKKSGNVQAEVSIWRAEDDKEFKPVEKIKLTKSNKVIDFIPVVIIGLCHQNRLKKPSLSGLAAANLSHFVSEANHETILYWSSAPIISISGDATSVGKLSITPGNVAMIPANSKLEYQEVTGQGAKSIRDKIKDKENLMASLGANIITAQQSAGTNLEVAKMHQAGSNSTLLSVSNDASAGLTKVLRIISNWEGEDEKVIRECKVDINQDFVSSKATPLELRAWLELYMKDGMSIETLMYNMQQGEMHRPDTDIQDEIDLIAATHQQENNDENDNAGEYDD